MIADIKNPIKSVWPAAESAPSFDFIPMYFAITAVAPPPRPKVIPIIINIYGNTYPSADRASPPTHLPINAVSVSIYIECTIIPNIIGSASFHNDFCGLSINSFSRLSWLFIGFSIR